MKHILNYLLIGACLLTGLGSCTDSQPKDDQPRRLELLFLGHNSKHHDSEQLAEILMQAYFKKGINITYTTNPDDMLREDFKLYDGLIVYANYDSITPGQAKALLNFVSSGKGFIPLHCASWCFRNSPEVVDLIGGQFKTHQYDSFKAVFVKPDNPILKGVPEFETEDETYVHDKLAKDIEVLTERVEGDHHEPYTWIKHYGKGRVFYTAYGHNEKTFLNPGFQQLVFNGISWAVGDRVRELWTACTMPEVKYVDARIPNYENRVPPPRFQEPLTPEQSMRLIQVPVGFELKLFAAEPDIQKPICMNWDEKGRLWVAETVDYPNMVRENKKEGRDRIMILEDTDGDGKADKFTVFADSLNIPTSFAFANGGIVVSQAPDFLFLKDTNGDDKADIRKTIIHGWGTFDTHAGPSNLKYGPDNRLWGTVGYSGFKGVIGNSKDTVVYGQGLYSFTPDGRQLEWLGYTSNNTWGLGFTEDYDVFLSTANNTHSAAFTIPKRYLDLVPPGNETGIEKIESHYRMHVATKNLRQVDVHNGFTAAAGHNFYTARKYPKDYWNRVAFVNEPTGRMIHKNIIEPDGSTFKEGEDGWNFVTSADDWFGPVQAEVGPDGNVWILDWYNFIIQHNPTPQGFDNGKGNAYINPLRDSTKGRIYVVRPKMNKRSGIQSLDRKDTDGLIRALKSDNMFWRITAQRLLVEAGDPKAINKLLPLVSDRTRDEIGLSPAALHALWTLQGLGAFDGTHPKATEALQSALTHPAAGVRRAAVMLLPANAESGESLLSAGAFEDEDLRVVLAAVLKTCDLPPGDALGKKLFELASRESRAAEDRWIQKALYVASRIQIDGFSKALTAGGINPEVVLGKIKLLHRIIKGDQLDYLELPSNSYIRPDRLPDLTGKELYFTAKVDFQPGEQPKGVVIAQGDMTNGYSVYIGNDKKLYFEVNQDRAASIIHSQDTVSNPFSFAIHLDKEGGMQLFENDREVATGKTRGLFTLPLRSNGLRIGQDAKATGANKAGNYPDSSRLTGGAVSSARIEALKVEGMVVDLGKPDQTIILKTVKHEMKFEQEQLTAKAGTVVEIIFDNVDFMQHNFLLLKPGSFQKVGAAADKLAESPEGLKLEYIPQIPEVLAATPLVNPDSKFRLKFRVPDIPGNYPYICSYPGHWRIMNGVLKVVK